MLKETPKAKGAEHGGRKSKIDGSRKEPTKSAPTLSDLGIDKKLSSRAQRLKADYAVVPEWDSERVKPHYRK